ncbi:MAG TPA: wax ester/triacylglycerol synthase family O-acyltransferase [Amycolatopsis sp.]|uniref:wax ester/triacylglycerol synthase family O-acyltransferase n=1 Tax=Amycolatopsis sp. TaxID=37632 RepID=UPI002B49EBE1|nr:wax ester/triacylglycerol synthase family O-acyltransferase [Amycolatopsis sp.]HKS47097.1 wax ester/triacylglycerol synthase family O-acyltransferase [Amycolatopsis sp.]
MAGEHLSGLDTAFWYLDDPVAPMNIGALVIFQPTRSVNVEKLVRLLAERIGRIPRLRQHVREVTIPPTAEWTDDPQFQVETHLRICCLARSGSRDQLNDYAAAAMARQLDTTRPPWEIHIITGLPDKRFALLVKIHHAITDGQSSGHLFASIYEGVSTAFETTAAVSGTTGHHADDTGPSLPRPARWLPSIASLVKPVTNLASQTARHAHIMAALARNIRLRGASPLVGKTSGPQREFTTVTLDVAAVNRIRRHRRATTHDIVLAVLAGALREWLETSGYQPGKCKPRALIPVALRNRGTVPNPGNHLSSYLCELPVSEPDPARRLDTVRTTMDRNKANGPYRGAGAFTTLANTLPAAAHRLLAPLAAQSAMLLFDILVSNVPMAGDTVRLANAPMCELYAMVPLARGHGLAVSITASRHFVGLALYSDPSILPNVAAIRDALPRALAELDTATASLPVQHGSRARVSASDRVRAATRVASPLPAPGSTTGPPA